jgi:HPr kinase/phosphorylase
MPQLSAARLFDDNREKLRLEWIAGRAGASRDIAPERVSASSEGLIGHCNLIHPNWIQVLGKTELSYLEQLDPIARQRSLADLAASDLFCLIVTGGEPVPAVLRDMAETHATTWRARWPNRRRCTACSSTFWEWACSSPVNPA